MVSKEFKMKYVYVVQHSHSVGDCDDTKFIGVFSSEKKALKAIKKLKKQKGFKQYKKDFYINKYPINKTYWKEGFIVNSGIEIPSYLAD